MVKTGTPSATPHTEAAVSVSAAERMLSDIIDTVRQPLLVLNHEFRVTHANRAFLRSFHVQRADTVGSMLFDLGDGQWDISPLRDMLANKLPAETQLEDIDVDEVFPGIGRKIMHLNARLVSRAPGEPRSILLSIEDVTELRATDRRLAEQREELQRSNSALQEFASIASHDLQEPLRKIVSFGERLNTVAGPLLDGDARHHLERILSAATRMRTLISGLLAYSQVTTRVHPFVATDLAGVAREVIADLETALTDSGGRVEVGPLPVIEADALLMRQLLQNLLTNAIKYRRPDVPSVVRVRATNGAGRCRLTVADNGIGFHSEHAEKIFKMFERLHGRGQYEGSGIGLAICRRIAERHGGTINATGVAGEGATFTVTLPIAQTAHGHTP